MENEKEAKLKHPEGSQKSEPRKSRKPAVA